MTKRGRVEATYRLEPADRIPFVPAIYEHKARLVGRSPSEVCRDPDLLEAALHRELDVYDPDMLVAGLDIYNVEAEALGCDVRYFDASNDIPSIASPRLSGPKDLEKLGLPDPEKDGRMPSILRVASRLAREKGADMIIRGGLTGPFSLACALAGTENVLVAGEDDPGFLESLLQFCGRVAAEFGRAFLGRGVDVVLFDSRATPKAASPRIFREFLLPVYRDIIMPTFFAAGARFVPLIIGGDTGSILDTLLETGATQLVCDAGCDIERFKMRCREERRAFRASVDARLVHRGSPSEIRAEALRLLRVTAGQPGLLFGCGVVAFDTEPANVLALRDALLEFSAT